MFLASLDRWHPVRLGFYGFLVVAAFAVLYCLAPLGDDPHLRIFRGLVAMYAAFLCVVAMTIQDLRRQDDAVYDRLISRVMRIRGLEGEKAASLERNWFATTGSMLGLSLLAPLYALSKAVWGWSELGWPDVVGPTCGMLVGPFGLCDFYFLLRRRLANRI